VGLVEDQLVVLLEDHHPIVGAARGGERADERGGPGAHRAGDEDVGAGLDALGEEAGHGAGDGAAADEVLQREIGALGLAHDDHVPLLQRRGDDREEAGAPREAALDEGLVVAEGAAGAQAEAADHPAHRVLAAEAQLGRDGAAAVHGHHVVVPHRPGSRSRPRRRRGR
jgi:hypothetical protein